jgi:hypothetical protein
MVLRSLWLVHAVLGSGLLFVPRLTHWVSLLSQAATVAVPATLGWLVTVCAARP